jgi:hypothetical protein
VDKVDDRILQFAGQVQGQATIVNFVNLRRYGDAGFVECDGNCCGSGDCGCQGDCSSEYGAGYDACPED